MSRDELQKVRMTGPVDSHGSAIYSAADGLDGSAVRLPDGRHGRVVRAYQRQHCDSCGCEIPRGQEARDLHVRNRPGACSPSSVGYRLVTDWIVDVQTERGLRTLRSDQVQCVRVAATVRKGRAAWASRLHSLNQLASQAPKPRGVTR